MKETFYILFFIWLLLTISFLLWFFYNWALNISEKDFKAKSLMTEEQRRTNEAIKYMQSNELKILVRQELIKELEKTEEFEACEELQKQIKQIENESN